MAAMTESIVLGFKEISSSLTKDPGIWWLLGPIILFWLIIEIYFGRHEKEKLGWNTALGNGLNIFWVVIISARALFTEGFFSIDKLIFITIISLYSIFIILVSFTHNVKESIFFLVASPTAVYYLSAVAVLWLHNLLKVNLWVLLDLVLLYLAILIVETILKKIIPPAKGGHHDFNLGQIDQKSE